MKLAEELMKMAGTREKVMEVGADLMGRMRDGGPRSAFGVGFGSGKLRNQLQAGGVLEELSRMSSPEAVGRVVNRAKRTKPAAMAAMWGIDSAK